MLGWMESLTTYPWSRKKENMITPPRPISNPCRGTIEVENCPFPSRSITTSSHPIPSQSHPIPLQSNQALQGFDAFRVFLTGNGRSHPPSLPLSLIPLPPHIEKADSRRAEALRDVAIRKPSDSQGRDGNRQGNGRPGG